jgi:murein DD-endopeptidase MepM/ murein hydrolase activator NlpD
MDLAQMDEEDRLVTGDPSQVVNYPSYGQYARSISAGRVVSVVDGLPDQVPGAPAPADSFDEDTAQGNAVVLALAGGRYAFYGGLKPGSIIVTEGTFVRAGQPLAQIGNSAAGLQPHLHFELLASPDRIGAEGLPFVFNSFGYAGRIDPGKLLLRGPAGPFSDDRLPVTHVRTAQLPLSLSILDFESSSGSSGNPLLS